MRERVKYWGEESAALGLRLLECAIENDLGEPTGGLALNDNGCRGGDAKGFGTFSRGCVAGCSQANTPISCVCVLAAHTEDSRQKGAACPVYSAETAAEVSLSEAKRVTCQT